MEKAIKDSTAKIVIITGPESTAKSTIAKGLAERFDGTYVPEYAREYVEGLDRPYLYTDIEAIGMRQKEGMNSCINSNTGKAFFVDTYLIITKVWFQWFGGKYPTWLDEEISKTKKCLYLLCAPDIEWVADNVREHGGNERVDLFQQYKEELEKAGLNFRIVTGKGHERMKNACTFVTQYLK